MAYVIGMLLGAFILLYYYYNWDLFGWYSIDDEESFWEQQQILYREFTWDCYIHSRASWRRVYRTWRTNALVCAVGAGMGWGVVDGLLKLV